MLTDEAQTIVAHFVQHMPEAKRAVFEAKVIEMLKQNERKFALVEDDEAMQATCACIDVMHALWQQARSEFQIAPPGLEVPSGGRLSTLEAQTQ